MFNSFVGFTVGGLVSLTSHLPYYASLMGGKSENEAARDGLKTAVMQNKAAFVVSSILIPFGKTCCFWHTQNSGINSLVPEWLRPVTNHVISVGLQVAPSILNGLYEKYIEGKPSQNTTEQIKQALTKAWDVTRNEIGPALSQKLTTQIFIPTAQSSSSIYLANQIVSEVAKFPDAVKNNDPVVEKVNWVVSCFPGLSS